MPVGMFWQIQSDFEAFICSRLVFWRLRALAAGLTGARQKQLVQFWLPGRLWAPIIFEAFICCRLLFWRLQALAAGLTGARQKQLVQFWLPGRLWAPISSWICKNIAARISLEAGRTPAASQCGRLKPRGLNVKASTQTQPRYWPVGGWVARCCVSKAQPVGRVVF